MNNWDGQERRTENTNLIVLVTEIRNDIKHMTKAFDQHVLDDAETAKKVSALELNIARWGGGIAALVCIVGVVISIVK